jgi:uncharacterized protein (TIGR02996 family)
VSEPFDPRLDAAILAEPTAAAPRQVLADFLEERGHPRAEFIRLALANEEPFAWIGKHRELLGVVDGVAVKWLYGFVDDITLVNANAPLDWPTIATHRTYRFARELSIVRHGFAFDAALPPPDGIRTLRIYYGAPTLLTVPRVAWPRTTRLVIDQHISRSIADPELIGAAVDALPHLAALEVANCLDEASVTALVARLAAVPLQFLKLDRLSEAAAHTLIEAGRAIDLVTQRESISAATRAKLATVVRWRPEPRVDAGPATSAPRHAPADFAGLAPVTVVADHGMWGAEWAGSGVSVYEHPMNARGGGTACGACLGTNTAVIWARHVYTPNAGWGPDHSDVSYELVCRDCEHFSVYDATAP